MEERPQLPPIVSPRPEEDRDVPMRWQGERSPYAGSDTSFHPRGEEWRPSSRSHARSG